MFDAFKVHYEAGFTALHGLNAGSQLFGKFVDFGLTILQAAKRVADERFVVGKATAGQLLAYEFIDWVWLAHQEYYRTEWRWLSQHGHATQAIAFRCYFSNCVLLISCDSESLHP